MIDVKETLYRNFSTILLLRTEIMKLTKTDKLILDSYASTMEYLSAYLGTPYEISLHSLEDYNHSEYRRDGIVPEDIQTATRQPTSSMTIIAVATCLTPSAIASSIVFQS